ncbi:hypothetical protein AMTRI_Chr03g50210 [Amborella trichopoda]
MGAYIFQSKKYYPVFQLLDNTVVLNANCSLEFGQKMAKDSLGNKKMPKANGYFRLESVDLTDEFPEERVVLWRGAWGEEHLVFMEKSRDKFQVGYEASIEFERKFIYCSEQRPSI